MELEEIKRQLRELRADPGQPGTRAKIQRLRGEYARAKQARDVADRSDTEAPPQRPKKWSPRRPADVPDEDATDEEKTFRWGNDVIPASWASAVRARRSIWRP